MHTLKDKRVISWKITLNSHVTSTNFATKTDQFHATALLNTVVKLNLIQTEGAFASPLVNKLNIFTPVFEHKTNRPFLKTIWEHLKVVITCAST